MYGISAEQIQDIQPRKVSIFGSQMNSIHKKRSNDNICMIFVAIPFPKSFFFI